VFAWVSRWLEQRRTREILGALVLLALLSMQLIGPVISRLGKHSSTARPELEPLALKLVPVAELLPPGLVAEALTARVRKMKKLAILQIVLLAQYGLFLVLF